MLRPGDTLLHYRVDEQIGEGAMGVVWRATDVSLGREVAVKILPDAFARDADRLARFEREAKLLASLNHPNIAAVYGLHEDRGLRFLAMELVAGEDLRKRLDRGPLPLDDALEIGREIASGLAAAHGGGVIHRDLKPANVQLAPGGQVKILDFGLAKAHEAKSVSGSGGEFTVTTAGTTAGVIMGTAAYMSPEQARGKAVDQRTDVWAFGCLLYECLAGKPAFSGETVTDVLASILHHEPDWNALPAAARPRVERLLRRCLVKDPRERVRDLGDVALVLREIASTSRDAPAAATAPERSSGRSRGWMTAAVIGAIALTAGFFLGGHFSGSGGGESAAPGAPHVAGMAALTDLPGVQREPDLSPDGKQLLFVSRDGEDDDIFLQRVGGENAINLTAGFDSNDHSPAFSPDGEKIAFASDRSGGGIFVMGATGESARRVSETGFHPAWSPDGTKIAYCTEYVPDPYGRLSVSSLWVVDLASGQSTKIHDGDAVQPRWSPSGERLAFWAAIQGQRDIWTIDAAGGAPVAVTQDAATDWEPFWSPDGRSIYFLSDRGGSPDLWRISIDPKTGAASGEPAPVTTGVAAITEGAISSDGTRVVVTAYQARGEILRLPVDPGTAQPRGDPVVLHRSGNALTQTDVSDDESWIAYRTTAPRENVFVMRTDGSMRRRLTDDGFRNRGPVWLRGNEWVLFYSNRNGSYEIWLVRSDGTDLRQITDAPGVDINVPLVSPDGKRVIVIMSGSGISLSTGILDVRDDWFASDTPFAPVKPDLLVDGFFPWAWSPDGKRIGGQAFRNGVLTPAIYRLDTGKLEFPELLGRASSTVFGITWLPDGRSLLISQGARDSAGIWNLETGNVRDVAAIRSPAEFQFSRDGRSLYVTRTLPDSEIWLLELE